MGKAAPRTCIGILIGVMGLVNVTSAITPALANRFQVIETLFPLQVTNGTRLATAMAGFALLELSAGISRGKRTAWMVTLGVLVLTFISHLIKGFDVEEASLALAIIIGMVLTSAPAFRPDRMHRLSNGDCGR